VESVARSIARRSLARSFSDREDSYADEIGRIIEATYRVIQRTGSVDPTMRDVLRDARLSTEAFYRHFRSKDELLLALMTDGQERLASYLKHRMDKQTTRQAKVRAWIEGVLAQASDQKAAARTRPFVANRQRLSERFPVEQQQSVDVLVDLLIGALRPAHGAGGRDRARRDAQAIYDVTLGALHRYLTNRTKPAAADVEHLVRFCLSAASGKA